MPVTSSWTRGRTAGCARCRCVTWNVKASFRRLALLSAIAVVTFDSNASDLARKDCSKISLVVAGSRSSSAG